LTPPPFPADEGAGGIPGRSRTGENPPQGILEGEEETRVRRVRVPDTGSAGVVSMWCASSVLDEQFSCLNLLEFRAARAKFFQTILPQEVSAGW
jgi:hypothetical protein